MNEEEFTATLAKINELESEHANIRAAVHDSIASARRLNDATRAGQQRLNALAESLATLRSTANAYVEAVNQARAKEAHAKAQLEAERRAQEP